MKNESIVLGGGCFWCLDAIYQRIKGVTRVTSGYAGGETNNPNYSEVCSGRTRHAEVIKIDFDSNSVALATILDVFWAMHDPTTLNQQGSDVGTQYRSIILHNSSEQKIEIEKSTENTAKKLWNKPIITEVTPLEEFWPAEEHHQDYFNKNPEQGYCQIIINPKLAKFKQKFSKIID
jgi:peptide-methionine (S)-S-oxide reductase